MIQLRKNPFSDTQIEIPFVEGENLKELLDRTLESNGYPLTEEVVNHFQIFINGNKIERDLWALCTSLESDTILIAPRIARGDVSQQFKQIAILAISIAASVYISPQFGGGLYGAMAAAAVTVTGALAMNSLIPPPELAKEGLGGGLASFEGSQMYTITSQSNSIKKFGRVPKVYGKHRIFPLLAANPYTEIEAESPIERTIFDNGTDTPTIIEAKDSSGIVQFFYAIYDFGLGPLEISDIRIGDTPINEYTDAFLRLVDPNKPTDSKETWDLDLYNDFAYYKGDVERDGTQYVLDFNESLVNKLPDYQVTRNASPKVNGDLQEISLDFVAPKGLISYASDGSVDSRTIDLKIEFSKVDENTWRPYNDYDYVFGSSAAGGQEKFENHPTYVMPIDVKNPTSTGYIQLKRTLADYWYDVEFGQEVERYISSYGIKDGEKKFLLKSSRTELGPGDALFLKDEYLGKLVSVTPSTVPGYYYYEVEKPVEKPLVIFEVLEYFGAILKNTKYVYKRAFNGSSKTDDKLIVKSRAIGIARISAKTDKAHYATIKFRPKDIAQYKVRITRVNSFSNPTYRVVDSLSLTSLSTRFDRNPIKTDKRHVFLELKIRATNQLSGSINNLSAVATSVLDVYDTETNTWKKQPTNNPAWVFCDLLTGQVNKKAVSKDRLHLPSILEWANFCSEVPTPPPGQSYISSRFTSNFVLDFDTTLQSLINNLTNSFQASLNLVDGKYGVLIDKQKTIPIQIFTPRNSTDFNSTRVYDESPHGLKIRYVDPFKEWEVSELVVYDDGYTEETATEFDEISTFACTNYEQAWRFGRYMLAQARLRKEKISINVDFEHIVCTRGDYVQITQDVMKVGGRPFRVKEVTGINTIKLDESLESIPGINYAYVFRSVEDGIHNSSCDILSSEELRLYGLMPSVGDLIVVGEANKVVFDCLVKSISPNSDLSATIELVEKADAIYLAESSSTLPTYDPQISVVYDERATPPAVVDLAVVSNSYRVKGGNYEYFIGLDWDSPIGAAIDSYEIYVNSGGGYDLHDITKNSFYEFIATSIDVSHSFKVLAVSANGRKITLLEAPEVSATPQKKISPPSNVTDINTSVTNEVLQLDWAPIPDEDVKEYVIRYSPKTTGAIWESSTYLLKSDKSTTLATTQARTGTYFIKSYDLNDNESTLAASAVTTIPNLFNLNIIEETNDFPDLSGEMEGTVLESGALMLKKLETDEFYPVGYYYYSNFLDLGDIYTVRLTSLIEAEGFSFSDLMSNWKKLSDIKSFVHARQSQWNVETEYRATNRYNVISEWENLALIDPISEGFQDNWTPWRKFTGPGDATGRVFQFRLKLVSNSPTVSPRVYEGKIRADMPDRYASENNITCPVGGMTVYYTPSFKGPFPSPNVQITQENAQFGDYFVISDKTLEGFKIEFFNSSNNSVQRTFDYMAKGYGRKTLQTI
jgi:hypothetical protein